jgi:ligand-binding SRPBCC domain-containing protein
VKLYRLERTQFLPLSLLDAWDFFSYPRNLPLITPPTLGFRLTCDPPCRMYPGLILTYRVPPFPPLSVSWVTEITHVDEPEFFVDEQRFGPYAFWHHQHHFREVPGGVEVRDLVHYALPLDPLGRIAARLVGKRLGEIFDFRRTVLDRRFTSALRE